MEEERRDIYSLKYSTGKSETVGIGGVTSIRLEEGDLQIAGSGGYLTTYVVERHNTTWKIVPAWMVVVEFRL